MSFFSFNLDRDGVEDLSLLSLKRNEVVLLKNELDRLITLPFLRTFVSGSNVMESPLALSIS